MAQVVQAASKEAGKRRKKGTTKTILTKAEEQQYMVYQMITDLFDFEKLK